MHRFFYSLIMTVLGLSVSGLNAADILIMYQPNNPDMDDPLAEWMESLGHTVEFLDTASQDPDEQIEFAEAADLVFVAESLGSTTTHDGLETHIKEVATPQIWAEAYAWDEAAITGDIQFEDFGNTQRANPDEDPVEELIDGQTTINIVAPDHPMAGGFRGEVQVYHDPYSSNWGLIETMGDGAAVIATLAPNAPEYASLFVYEQGAKLEDGTPAAGMRIGIYLGQGGDGTIRFDNITDDGLKLFETAIDYGLGLLEGGGPPELLPGDADRDLDFDQLDLVSVQIAAKYLTGQAATWGEGDWNGAPGGSQDEPPAGDGQFSQLDIIASLGPGHYLTGPYAAINQGGVEGDGQTSIVYDAGTGELAVDAPAGVELTSINIDSAGAVFTGEAAQNLGGSFDNDADNNIFKATFGSSFGSLSFGNVAQTGLSEDFVANDLTVVGSLNGGGDLGAVDLIYVPEPSALFLFGLGLAGMLLMRMRKRD